MDLHKFFNVLTSIFGVTTVVSLLADLNKSIDSNFGFALLIYSALATLVTGLISLATSSKRKSGAGAISSLIWVLIVAGFFALLLYGFSQLEFKF